MDEGGGAAAKTRTYDCSLVILLRCGHEHILLFSGDVSSALKCPQDVKATVTNCILQSQRYFVTSSMWVNARIVQQDVNHGKVLPVACISQSCDVDCRLRASQAAGSAGRPQGRATLTAGRFTSRSWRSRIMRTIFSFPLRAASNSACVVYRVT